MIPTGGNDPGMSPVTQGQAVSTSKAAEKTETTTTSGKLYAPPHVISVKDDAYYEKRALREVTRAAGGTEKFNQLSKSEQQSRMATKIATLRRADQIVTPKSYKAYVEANKDYAAKEAETSTVAKRSYVIGKRLPREEKSSRIINNAAQTPLKQIKEDFKVPDKMPQAPSTPPPRALPPLPKSLSSLPKPPSNEPSPTPTNVKPLPPLPPRPSSTPKPSLIKESSSPNKPLPELPDTPVSKPPAKALPDLPDTPFIPPAPDYAPPVLAPKASTPLLQFHRVLNEAHETEKTFIANLEKLSERGKTMAQSDEKKIKAFGEELEKSVQDMLKSAKTLHADLKAALEKPNIGAQLDATSKAYADHSKSYYDNLKKLAVKQESFDAKFDKLTKKHFKEMEKVFAEELQEAEKVLAEDLKKLGMPAQPMSEAAKKAYMSNNFRSSTITSVQRGPRHELLLRDVGKSTEKMYLSGTTTKAFQDATKGVIQGNVAVNTERKKIELVGGYDKYVDLCEKYTEKKVDNQLSSTVQVLDFLDSQKIAPFDNIITLAEHLNRSWKLPDSPVTEEILGKQFPIEEMKARLDKMKDIRDSIKNDPMDLKNSSQKTIDEAKLLTFVGIHENLKVAMNEIFESLSTKRESLRKAAAAGAKEESFEERIEKQEKIKKEDEEIKKAEETIKSAIDPDSKEKHNATEFKEALQRLGIYTPEEPPEAAAPTQGAAAQRSATTKGPSRMRSAMRTPSKLPRITSGIRVHAKSPSKVPSKSPSAMSAVSPRTNTPEDLKFAENVSKKIDARVSFYEQKLQAAANKMQNEDNSTVTNLLMAMKNCTANINKLNALKTKVNDSPAEIRQELARQNETLKKAKSFVQGTINDVPQWAGDRINRLKDLANKTQASEEEKNAYFNELDALSSSLANTIEEAKDEFQSPSFTAMHAMYELKGENLVKIPISDVGIAKQIMVEVNDYSLNEIPKAVGNFENNFMHKIFLKGVYGEKSGLPAFPKLGAAFSSDEEKQILSYFKSRTNDEAAAKDLQTAYITLRSAYSTMAGTRAERGMDYYDAAENFMNLYSQLPPA